MEQLFVPRGHIILIALHNILFHHFPKHTNILYYVVISAWLWDSNGSQNYFMKKLSARVKDITGLETEFSKHTSAEPFAVSHTLQSPQQQITYACSQATHSLQLNKSSLIFVDQMSNFYDFLYLAKFYKCIFQYVAKKKMPQFIK